jgi:hypothetical protein
MKKATLVNLLLAMKITPDAAHIYHTIILPTLVCNIGKYFSPHPSNIKKVLYVIHISNISLNNATSCTMPNLHYKRSI